MTGSNRDRMVAVRVAGESWESTAAEESVIAAPKPCIVW